MRFQHPATMTEQQRDTLRRPSWPAVRVQNKSRTAVAFLGAEVQGRFHVKAYTGKALKGSYFAFRTDVARAKWVQEYLLAADARHASKAAAKTGRVAPKGIEEGAIFYASWGYDQTNIDFFQVVKVVGPWTIEVREIRSIVEHTGDMTGTCVPDIDAFKGDVTRKRLNASGRFNDGIRYSSLWDGMPKHWSSYA